MTPTTEKNPPLKLEPVPNAEIQQDSLTNERRFLALLFKGKEHLQKALAAGVTHEFFLNYMQGQIFGCMAKYYSEHNALLGFDTFEAILRQRMETPEEVGKWTDEYHSIIRQHVSENDFAFLCKTLKENHVHRYGYTLAHRYLDLFLKAKGDQSELVAKFQQDVAGIKPADTLPAALTLDAFSHGDDNGGNLLGNRLLCRAGGLLIAAPTGVGKSSWVTQAGVSWSLGLPHLGIKPAAPLTVLIIQAENDSGDVAELRDGVFRGLSLTAEQITTACQRVKIVCETCKTGADFVALVSALVALHHPDLIIIDPLFSYLGSDLKDQKAVSEFLRNGLNPILQRHRCGLVLVHHTPKPSRNEKSTYSGSDHAYDGYGTVELSNWARATISINSTGEDDAFEMVLGKRWKRAGLVDEWQQPVRSVFIHYSKTGICWHVGSNPTAVKKSKLDVLNLVPPTGAIGKARFDNNAADAGLPQKRMRGWLAELIEDGQLHVWETQRTGKRPALSYSRHPQSENPVAVGKATGNEKTLPVTTPTNTDELLLPAGIFPIPANSISNGCPQATGKDVGNPNGSSIGFGE